MEETPGNSLLSPPPLQGFGGWGVGITLPSLIGPGAVPGFGAPLSFGGTLGSVWVSWGRRVSPTSWRGGGAGS